jgi:hypothetical protein
VGCRRGLRAGSVRSTAASGGQWSAPVCRRCGNFARTRSVRSWRIPDSEQIIGVAIGDEVGARVFVTAGRLIAEVDTRTGAVTVLMSSLPPPAQTGKPRNSAGEKRVVAYPSGVAVDRVAGALVFADHELQCISRLCGVQLM